MSRVMFYMLMPSDSFFSPQMNVDPDSLIPKLPDPRDLQPFPSQQSLVCLILWAYV